VFLRAFENSGIEEISRFETGEGSSATSNVRDVTDVMDVMDVTDRRQKE